ncbi:hypothetical protein GMSM_16010 [Geomonas sp. Red276]
MERLCKNGIKLGVLAVVLVVAVVTAVWAFEFPGLGGKYQKVKAANGVVSVPLAKVNDGNAHFFKYSEGGKELNFFIVKGSGGQIHSAFDACDVCYHEKKGYVQQGGNMICKNCNKKFPITQIGAQADGGCNPSYLPARVDASTVRIKVSDLKGGARLF